MRWKVRLSDDAQQDFDDIIVWTIKRFSALQATLYADVLTAAIGELDEGPQLPGARGLCVDGRDYFILHVPRHGRKGRHFLVFRVKDARQRILEVARILHDAMDAPRHLR